jgi:hypothetical protein
MVRPTKASQLLHLKRESQLNPVMNPRQPFTRGTQIKPKIGVLNNPMRQSNLANIPERKGSNINRVSMLSKPKNRSREGSLISNPDSQAQLKKNAVSKEPATRKPSQIVKPTATQKKTDAGLNKPEKTEPAKIESKLKKPTVFNQPTRGSTTVSNNRKAFAFNPSRGSQLIANNLVVNEPDTTDQTSEEFVVENANPLLMKNKKEKFEPTRRAGFEVDDLDDEEEEEEPVLIDLNSTTPINENGTQSLIKTEESNPLIKQNSETSFPAEEGLLNIEPSEVPQNEDEEEPLPNEEEDPVQPEDPIEITEEHPRHENDLDEIRESDGDLDDSNFDPENDIKRTTGLTNPLISDPEEVNEVFEPAILNTKEEEEVKPLNQEVRDVRPKNGPSEEEEDDIEEPEYGRTKPQTTEKDVDDIPINTINPTTENIQSTKNVIVEELPSVVEPVITEEPIQETKIQITQEPIDELPIVQPITQETEVEQPMTEVAITKSIPKETVVPEDQPQENDDDFFKSVGGDEEVLGDGNINEEEEEDDEDEEEEIEVLIGQQKVKIPFSKEDSEEYAKNAEVIAKRKDRINRFKELMKQDFEDFKDSEKNKRYFTDKVVLELKKSIMLMMQDKLFDPEEFNTIFRHPQDTELPVSRFEVAVDQDSGAKLSKRELYSIKATHARKLHFIEKLLETIALYKNDITFFQMRINSGLSIEACDPATLRYLVVVTLIRKGSQSYNLQHSELEQHLSKGIIVPKTQKEVKYAATFQYLYNPNTQFLEVTDLTDLTGLPDPVIEYHKNIIKPTVEVYVKNYPDKILDYKIESPWLKFESTKII